MALLLIGGLFALYLLYAGLRFYRNMDWDEPVESSPDVGALRKKEAELLHIQDVLRQAQAAGKLSPQVVEEFVRYCDAQIREMKAIQSAWKRQRQDRK